MKKIGSIFNGIASVFCAYGIVSLFNITTHKWLFIFFCSVVVSVMEMAIEKSVPISTIRYMALTHNNYFDFTDELQELIRNNG